MAYMMKSKDNPSKEHFVKVPMKNAFPLIRSRQCFVWKGQAYLNKEKHLETLVSEFFKSDLSKVLNYTYKHLGTIIKDGRMKELLKNISKKDLIDFEYKSDNKALKGKINLGNIDLFARKHFPPCMLGLHGALRNNHHLKHYGRL